MKRFFKQTLKRVWDVFSALVMAVIWLVMETVMVLSSPIWIWGVLVSNPVKLLPLAQGLLLFGWCYKGIIIKSCLREEQPDETKALVIEELLGRNPTGLPTSVQVAYLSWLPSDECRIVAMEKLNRDERKNVVGHIVKAGGFALLKGVYDKSEYWVQRALYNDIIDAIQNPPSEEVAKWIRVEVLCKRCFITDEVEHILENKACWDIFFDDEKKILIASLMPNKQLKEAMNGMFEEYNLLSSNDGFQILASYAKSKSLPIEIIAKLFESRKASGDLQLVVNMCFSTNEAENLRRYHNLCRAREKEAT